MLNTIFLIAAVIGGTVMVCQFALTLIGIGGDEVDGAGADFSGDADFGGDVGDVDLSGDLGDVDASGDGVEGDHHNSWSQADDPDVSHPDSSGVFKVVSFRTLVAAIAFFGITGAAARSASVAPAPSILIALACGIAAMYGTYYLMQSITRLDSSGNENIANAIGKKATVYLTIPASQAGLGKVQLSMQNRIVEFLATTSDDEPLKTGETVEVVAVKGHDTLEVRGVGSPVSV